MTIVTIVLIVLVGLLLIAGAYSLMAMHDTDGKKYSDQYPLIHVRKLPDHEDETPANWQEEG